MPGGRADPSGTGPRYGSGYSTIRKDLRSPPNTRQSSLRGFQSVAATPVAPSVETVSAYARLLSFRTSVCGYACGQKAFCPVSMDRFPSIIPCASATPAANGAKPQHLVLPVISFHAAEP